MYIEAERIIIREFELSDAKDLYEIKYDEQVMKYIPDMMERDADLEDVKNEIQYFISQRDTGNYEKEICYAVCLKESGQLIGAISVSVAGYLRETQIGWMFLAKYRGHGYAPEAGRAVSDYILETYQLDYMVVVMDTDNKASFRTAQKSGFQLFEKRVPYDYHYSKCNVENFDEVGAYFAHNQAEVESTYYIFRKYNPNVKPGYQFYGDIVYTGRFS